MTDTNKRYSPREFVPYGLVVTKSWLLSQGLSRHTLDNWLKSGQLTSVAYGVYTQPDVRLTGESLVRSLQRMGNDLCPGGLTALSYKGFAHYLSLGKHETIHLYGENSLPLWLNKLLPDVTFIRHSHKKLLGNNTDTACAELLKEMTVEMPIDLALSTSLQAAQMSSPERAWFEILLDVPDKLSFEHADQLMQGFVNLSPLKLNKLLDCCQNVKVRRLFLWFAERHQHAWLKKIDLECYTVASGLLGSGKRVLEKGGKLDSKYLITVPAHMYETGMQNE